MRRIITPALLLVVASILSGFASAWSLSRPTLTVIPNPVRAGRPVSIKGSAAGCPVGDTVTLISRAFPAVHTFAGVPAVLTKVRPGATFHASTLIPLSRRGSYPVTGRCGGGNLGVFVRLRVTASIFLTVAPNPVEPGHALSISGSANGCPVGDTVTLLSQAFPATHQFAGVPAVLTAVRPGGSFHARTTIPLATRARTYTVTGRCGGGNLGVLVHLRVEVRGG